MNVAPLFVRLLFPAPLLLFQLKISFYYLI